MSSSTLRNTASFLLSSPNPPQPPLSFATSGQGSGFPGSSDLFLTLWSFLLSEMIGPVNALDLPGETKCNGNPSPVLKRGPSCVQTPFFYLSVPFWPIQEGAGHEWIGVFNRLPTPLPPLLQRPWFGTRTFTPPPGFPLETMYFSDRLSKVLVPVAPPFPFDPLYVGVFLPLS